MILHYKSPNFWQNIETNYRNNNISLGENVSAKINNR